MSVPLIPAAIGVALSPAAIIELILVLPSKRAKVNGIVFLLTLWAGAFVVPLVGAFVVDTVTSDNGSGPSVTKGWILLVLGALLLLLAFRNKTPSRSCRCSGGMRAAPVSRCSTMTSTIWAPWLLVGDRLWAVPVPALSTPW